ncbi:iron-containing redox enzyme family protein [Jiulongibacter sediminis]|uniref:Iron-containing redox enzyme family protein n=1 Tax=Jiulongibacter sediminis TaxID=1605367 RepID=A0A0P7C6G0_9BACT|nr:iron-containing redox enzyme family protein [Jiulongibacter sediminis]KPM47891.1 hypothetical protein AFM12_11685 [Jiulongibacter sediminis]TBX24074.1 hypothetical protein TK44_11695 [Jiulongibacter sediminis]
MIAQNDTLKTSLDFMDQLALRVENANLFFAEKLKKNFSETGLKPEQYIRYLQMQYHLTKGVQDTFMAIASHSETRAYKKLRKFLINFAFEEEMHYKLAEKDLKNTGAGTGDIPFPVELWWAYQRQAVIEKPMERLGATAVLENVGNFAAPIIKDLLGSADFIHKRNTTFTQVHMHEELPHGDQILDALGAENFSEVHQAQLLSGAEKATWLYASTIFDWIIKGELTLVY